MPRFVNWLLVMIVLNWFDESLLTSVVVSMLHRLRVLLVLRMVFVAI